MIRARKGLTEEEWTPPGQEGEAEVVKLKLRPLRSPDLAECLDRCTQRDDGSTQTMGLVMAAQRGIVGWENLRDEDGNPVPYTKQAIATLPVEVLYAAGEQIMAISQNSEAELRD